MTPAMLGPGHLPRRSDDVRVLNRSDQTVLVSSEGTPHVVNATALALWELCDGATSPREMVNALDQFFDAPRGEIETAVRTMLEELTDLGLLRWVTPATASGLPEPSCR